MWQVVTRTDTLNLIKQSLLKDRLAHAFLISGSHHVGKMTLALDMARAVNCGDGEVPCGECTSCRKITDGAHADVRVIGLADGSDGVDGRSRSEISIEQIREIRHQVSLPPFEGKCKVFIVEGAENLSLAAANALLKTLEEPTARVLFILLCVEEDLIPPTVASRCQRVRLYPLPAEEIKKMLMNNLHLDEARAGLLAQLSHGAPGWAISAARDESILAEYRENVTKLFNLVKADYDTRFCYAAELVKLFARKREAALAALDLWIDVWRDLMLIRAGCSQLLVNTGLALELKRISSYFALHEILSFIGNIQDAVVQLKQNVSPQLVLEVLMLNMPYRKRMVA